MESITRPWTRGGGGAGHGTHLSSSTGRGPDGAAGSSSRFIDLDLEASGSHGVDSKRSWLKLSLGSAGVESSKQGTRPPIVGRENHPDPRWSKRYSEEDTDLEKYLQTLKIKASAEPGGLVVGSGPAKSISDEDGVSPAPKYTTGNRSFLKSKNNAELPDAKTVIPAFVPAYGTAKAVTRDRISSALSKVADLSSKYKREPARKLDEEENIATVVDREITNLADRVVLATTSRIPATGLLLNDHDDVVINEKTTSDISSESSLVVSVESGEDLMNVRGLSELEFPARRPGSLLSARDVSKATEAVDTGSSQSVSDSVSTESSRSSGREKIRYSDDFESELEENSAGSTPGLSETSRDRLSLATSLSANEPTPAAARPLGAFRRRGGADKATQTGAINVDAGAILVTMETEAKGERAKYRDPARISGTVVSEEAIKAFSTFRPSVMAMNEMMRQHIRSTRLFVESQRRNYLSTIYVLKADHRYTTWDDVEKTLARRRTKRTS